MDTIEQFDKVTVRKLAEEAQELLKPLEEKYGIKIKLGGGTFTPGDFTPKITFKVSDADQQEFKRYASLVGLEPEDFGRTFVAGGKTYKLTGINLRARKFPIQAVNLRDGKTYKMTEASVLNALGRPTHKVDYLEA